MASLLATVIRNRGLAEEVRQRVVGTHWDEIAGAKFAACTPESFSDGVLRVSVKSSTLVQEMQFYKAEVIATINAWVHAHRSWLGPAPLVTDLRVALRTPRREPFVDPEHVRRIRLLRRSRTAPAPAPPITSQADREAILRETATVADAELRALIEGVRVRWNR